MFWPSTLAGALAIVACSPPAPPAPPPTPAPVAPSAAPVVAASLAESTVPAVDCPRATSFETDLVAREVECLLQRYIQIDTTNPPGHEIAAARFLAQVLADEGIESEVAESAPGRGNLMARLHATNGPAGAAPALMLVHHTDVVPAEASDWSVPPFAGVTRDGYVWGRGSLDNKGMGIAHLVACLMLKRLGVPLDRDVVFLAVADEESGGEYGARWLLQHEPDWFRGIGYALNEGGAIIDAGQGHAMYSVELAQKAPLWLRVTAHGTSGHGSAPEPNTAAAVLVRALARLAAYQFPTLVIPEVQAMFQARAQALSEAKRAPFRDLAASLKQPKFRDEFMQNPRDAALVHNTLAITQLTGSAKENVISGQASAVLDMRLLPGQNVDAVLADVRRVMAEPSLQIEPLLSWAAQRSPRDTPLFAAIEALAKTRDPGAPVMANVIGGFTDCNAFRAANIVCYGFHPMRLNLTDLHGIHGKDEKIQLTALAESVAGLHALFEQLAKAEPSK